MPALKLSSPTPNFIPLIASFNFLFPFDIEFIIKTWIEFRKKEKSLCLR